MGALVAIAAVIALWVAHHYWLNRDGTRAIWAEARGTDTGSEEGRG